MVENREQHEFRGESDREIRDKAGSGDMTVSEAGHLGGDTGGQKGGQKVKELIEEGKRAESEKR